MSENPITEFAILHLKPGVSVTSSTPEAALFRSDIIGTLKQQDGMNDVRWGHQLENPSILILAVDWTNYKNHEKFIDSAPYSPFVKKLQDNFVTDLSLHHAFLPPRKTGLLTSAPCIELATFYGIEEGCMENIREFEQKAVAEGCHGMVYGETMEEISKEDGGEKAKAAILCIGWDSREKHMEYRESKNFKENIALLRVKNKGASVVHVKFIT